jgi:hypothetical protein
MVALVVAFQRVSRAVLVALAAFLLGAGLALAAGPAPDETSPANRLFVKAMQTIDKADQTFDLDEESRLLHEAEKLLGEIVTKYPDSALAVQLVTGQFVGDFDYGEFKGRLKALVCNEPLSSMCFLHRISELLPPVEAPVSVARWDWLSLAVAYHSMGDPVRAKEIMSPFVAVVRRGSGSDSNGEDLFVARALSMMGEVPIALDITRRIADCSTRVYNLTDISRAALWADDRVQATALAEEAAQYAAANGCAWEQGLVVQALHRVGKDNDARALLKATVDSQFAKDRDKDKDKDGKADCCAPELAVATAEIGDPNLALNILRVVQDENPWTIPAVVGRLSRRGETGLALAYAEQLRDADLQGESYAELVDAALARKDRKGADEAYRRLDKLTEQAQGRRPALLAQKAKAVRLLFNDDRWRHTFLAAINSAERASNFVRRDIGAPLLAVLVRISTGQPMLD